MSLAAIDAIDDAISATRSLLWPFDLGRWARLAFVMFFLGSMGGVNPIQIGNFGNVGSSGVPNEPGGPTTNPNWSSVSEFVGAISASEWLLIGSVVGAVLLIGLAFAFVGAVMEFVFVESLRRERVSIREYWGQRWRQGARLLGFEVGVGLLTLLIGGGAVLAAVWPILTGGPTPSVWLLVLAAIVFIVVAVLSGLVTGFTTQFVVPVMIAEDRGVLGAWRRFWPTLTGEWKEYVVYLVMRFVLNMAVGIAVGILSFIVGIAVAIPLLMLGVVGAVVIQSIQIVGWAVVAVAIALFIASMIVLSLFVAVPVQTFTRYYALLVLGDTNTEFDLVAERRRAIRGEEAR